MTDIKQFAFPTLEAQVETFAKHLVGVDLYNPDNRVLGMDEFFLAGIQVDMICKMASLGLLPVQQRMLEFAENCLLDEQQLITLITMKFDDAGKLIELHRGFDVGTVEVTRDDNAYVLTSKNQVTLMMGKTEAAEFDYVLVPEVNPDAPVAEGDETPVEEVEGALGTVYGHAVSVVLPYIGIYRSTFVAPTISGTPVTNSFVISETEIMDKLTEEKPHLHIRQIAEKITRDEQILMPEEFGGVTMYRQRSSMVCTDTGAQFMLLSQDKPLSDVSVINSEVIIVALLDEYPENFGIDWQCRNATVYNTFMYSTHDAVGSDGRNVPTTQVFVSKGKFDDGVFDLESGFELYMASSIIAPDTDGSIKLVIFDNQHKQEVRVISHTYFQPWGDDHQVRIEKIEVDRFRAATIQQFFALKQRGLDLNDPEFIEGTISPLEEHHAIVVRQAVVWCEGNYDEYVTLGDAYKIAKEAGDKETAAEFISKMTPLMVPSEEDFHNFKVGA